MAPQLSNRMLGGLGLQLLAGGNVWHQSDVDIRDVGRSDVLAELADGFEERQDLNVADRSPNLGDDHINIRVVTEPANARLDLVRDMGNHLNGRSEEVATPFLLDYGQIYGPGGDVGVTPQVFAGKALVMTEVEVGLSPIIGDEDFPVLERVQGAGVDVEVGVEFLIDHS